MPPPDHAEPERHDTESLDHLVIERVRREIRASGREVSITSRLLRAIRNALYRTPLEKDETAAHEALRGSPQTDSVSALISMRVETALNTALDEACKELGDGQTKSAPSVVVLRRATGDTASQVDAQVSVALSEVKSRVGGTARLGGTAQSAEHARSSRRVDSSRLLLLAHSAAFEKLRRRLPALLADDQKRVVFISRRKRDEVQPTHAASDIEIVQADAELEPLEQHLVGLLAKQREAPAHVADESMGYATGGTQSPERRAADTAPDPLIGTLFHNKYRIVRKIGHGGFGSVYEARDERGAGNRVAIKVLRTDLAGNRALFQSFKNEARRVTRLSHPNIVDWKVFDETEDGTQYLVMELVEGEELDRVLSREGALSPARVSNILLQILDALRAAHHLAEGGSILHLDLKPRNVFLVQGKRDKPDLVKVIDFGIGQYVGGEEEEELPDLDADTPAHAPSGDTGFNPTTMSFHRKREEEAAGEASSETKGTRFKRSRACTPEYASPEQCVHVLGMPEMIELDGRSDIYSLGVMGFQMLTGHLPFQRPLMRSDMLRLHMQKAPRKVGAMGVRIPRGLARFIDRCLEKNRDKRFADTTAAWRELHRIVHPPVSHTVAKVVAPLAIIALIAIGTLWAKVGARNALVPLAAPELGIDLARDVLYLGPSRPAAVVAASTAEGQAVLESGSPARLLLADGKQPLEGWSATRGEAGHITLAPTTPPKTSLDHRVVLDLGDADVEFQPFRLVWLADDAWSLRSISVGSARLYEAESATPPAARPIDPTGQSLNLRIGAAAADTLDLVRVKSGNGKPLDLAVAQKQGSDLFYRTSLADLGLSPGANDITVAVTDRAGRTFEQVVPLQVIADSLVWSEAKLLDRASPVSSECNQVLGRYSIYPLTRPLLRLVFDRPVDVKWSIRIDGNSEVQASQTSAGKSVHEIPLDSTAPFAGTSEVTGSIVIEADDGAHVVHAEGSTRGRGTRELLFERTKDAASIAVQYDAGELEHTLIEGKPYFVNRHDVELIVARQSGARVKIAVSAKLDDGSEASNPVTSSLKTDTEAKIPLRLARDGRYVVTVNAFQYLTQSDAVGDRPDVSQQYTIVVDTIAPKIDVRGLQSGALVLPKDGRAGSLDVSLGGGDGTIAGSPVDVTWAIIAGAQTTPAKTGAIGHDLAEPAKLSFDLPDLWGGAAGLPDGDHALVVQARDVAGNTSEPARIAFSVAASGPRLELESPQEQVAWKRTPNGDWQIELHASDPNGVDQVTCDVLRVGTQSGTQNVAMSTTSTDRAGDQVWTGRVLFPETWSKAEAKLRLSARDRAGVPTLEEKGPFRLPEIEAARPELVSVVVPDGKAERMRHVTGNSGFIYKFGGQGDEFENKLFVQAGLDRFNDKLGQTGRQISWAIAYAAGDIEDFYLDEHEVTCGQFLEFMQHAQGYSDRSHWPDASARADAARIAELKTRLAGAARDLPVTDVTWDEASAYAHWIGKRLPSWVEWEYAARGGQAYRPFAACASASSKTAEINVARADGSSGAWPRGRGADITPDTSLANLTGNVAEWTSSPDLTQGKEGIDIARHAAEHARELLRPDDAQCTHYYAVGGSYARSVLNFFTYDSRVRGSRRPSLGFRCAASLSDVRDKLADGRFVAQESGGAIPK